MAPDQPGNENEAEKPYIPEDFGSEEVRKDRTGSEAPEDKRGGQGD